MGSATEIKPGFEYALEGKRFVNTHFATVLPQYCQLYHVRLQGLRPALLKSAVKEFGENVGILPEISAINTSKIELKKEYILLGTILKVFKGRESVFIKGGVRETVDVATDIKVKWADDTKDRLAIHDDTSSIELEFDQVGKFVTGMCIAFKGYKEMSNSPFTVTGVAYPMMTPSPTITIKSTSKNKYIGFVSGPLLAKKDFLAGLFQFVSSNNELAHLIIAGNGYSNTLSKISKADKVFAALGKFVSVDFLPGTKDRVSGSMLPQRPPGAILFPISGSSKKVQGCLSPYHAKIEDIMVLGTGGENIDDISRCTTFDQTLDCMELSLKSRHLAPTCPDTLKCPSFTDVDRLLLNEQAPHVYFAGGQNQFAGRVDENMKTLLLSVPDLRRDPCIVLVDASDFRNFKKWSIGSMAKIVGG